jgi:hypothetical protein
VTEPLNLIKYGAVVRVSRADLLDNGFVTPTDAEQREITASLAEHDARRAAATEAWPAFVAALDAITDPVARAVLDLHSADTEPVGKGECQGCDIDGYECERPYWPCRTVITIAGLFGIEVHPDPRYAEQYAGRY